MIRFIEKTKIIGLFIKVPVVLRADSECLSEYQELIDKIYIPS